MEFLFGLILLVVINFILTFGFLATADLFQKS